jgi:cystathionine beta-lyase
VSKPPAENLVRLHIGLEDPDDLIEDLVRSFSALPR